MLLFALEKYIQLIQNHLLLEMDVPSAASLPKCPQRLRLGHGQGWQHSQGFLPGQLHGAVCAGGRTFQKEGSLPFTGASVYRQRKGSEFHKQLDWLQSYLPSVEPGSWLTVIG